MGQVTITVNDRFLQNVAALDVSKSCMDIVIFDPEKHTGRVDLRSIKQYKNKHHTLYQNHTKYCRFESAEGFCKEYNKLTNR